MNKTLITLVLASLLGACQQESNHAVATDSAATAQTNENDATQTQSESERLNLWFADKYEQQLQMSPIGLTFLGRKDKYDEVDDMSEAAQIEQLAWLAATVKELKESDIIIISAPIYNYGPPATLKAWSDLAARIGETFKFKPNGRREGLLKNKHAYLVITSGGTKLNSSEDFLTPWLKFILNFFGIEKVDIISADQMALDYEKSIKDAEAQIENLFKD